MKFTWGNLSVGFLQDGQRIEGGSFVQFRSSFFHNWARQISQYVCPHTRVTGSSKISKQSGQFRSLTGEGSSFVLCASPSSISSSADCFKFKDKCLLKGVRTAIHSGRLE